MQQIEVAGAPLGGGKAEPGNEREQHHEDGKSGPIHFSHGIPPNFLFPAPRWREAFWREAD